MSLFSITDRMYVKKKKIQLRGSSRYQQTCHEPSCYTPLLPGRCWKISALGRPTTVPLFFHASSLSSPSGSLERVCKPNMALIWPAPAPNPIIKTACLNTSHCYGPFQGLMDRTMNLLCAETEPCLPRVVSNNYNYVEELDSPHFLPISTCPATQCPGSSAGWPTLLPSS